MRIRDINHPRADNVLSYIIGYKQAHGGNNPTYREIMDATGITSTSMVAFYMRMLEERGDIRAAGGRGRYEVTGGEWRLGA